MKDKIHFDSICAREVEDPRTTAPHVLPIYATSSFEFENIGQGIDIFTGKEKGHVYSRYGNPTVEAVAQKIAMLETYGLPIESQAYLFSSGMSAITALLLSTLKEGDKVLTQGNLYGGSTELLLKIFSRLGIQTQLLDLKNLDLVESTLKKDTSIKLLYFETPANPTHACVDIKSLADLAKKYGCKSAVDNTFATPYLQKPFEWGVDLIVHSTTKYLNGHGNSIAGALVGNDPDFMRTEVWKTMKLSGTNCNPWDAWLVHLGMKTLTLRMDRHSNNAMKVAKYLEMHPKVDSVNYCGLPSHPDHQLAKMQMSQFGGMLSFELRGGLQAGIRLMENIRFCTLAPTLGDVDTLILHPASMSHLNIPKEVRLENGITDGLIRVSVGIEHPQDIMDDLSQALDRVDY